MRPRAFAAVFVGEGFGDKRCAGGPFTTHAEAEQDAENRELRDRLREAAGRGEDGVDQHRGHQGAGASETIGDEAEGQASDRGSD